NTPYDEGPFTLAGSDSLRSRLQQVADTLQVQPIPTEQLTALLREAAASVVSVDSLSWTIAELGKLADAKALPIMQSLQRAGHNVTLNQAVTMGQIADALAVEQPQGTPSSRWAADGEPDPHGTRYDCERAGLAMGMLTDDELANGAYLNYDARPPLDAIVAGQ